MGDEGASAALVRAVAATLREVPGLSSVSDGAPVQAGDANAVIETGPETDWGHKSGAGAEVRLALLIRCGGEQPRRARALLDLARRAVDGLSPVAGGWRLVSMTMLRARVVRAAGPGWIGMADYRARLLRD